MGHKVENNEFLVGNLNYLDEIKDVKVTKKRRSLKPVIIMLLVVAGLFGGVLVALDVSNRPINDVVSEGSSQDVSNNESQTQLFACLGTVNTDVNVGDPEFFGKMIAGYEAQISCYDKYDSGNFMKKNLEERLNSVKVAANDAGSSEANAAEYERRAAQIEAEYRQQMAALNAEAARQDEETRRGDKTSASTI